MSVQVCVCVCCSFSCRWASLDCKNTKKKCAAAFQHRPIMPKVEYQDRHPLRNRSSADVVDLGLSTWYPLPTCLTHDPKSRSRKQSACPRLHHCCLSGIHYLHVSLAAWPASRPCQVPRTSAARPARPAGSQAVGQSGSRAGIPLLTTYMFKQTPLINSLR